MQVGDPPVGGRYSLVAPFGADERFAGGKVQTWRARDTLVERDVVLRVIAPGGNSAKLFLDRALEMSMVAHPGLGMVYEAVDHGEYAIVVCEWIDGTSLADTLAAHGPLSPALARTTLGDVAEAITIAHHAGLPIGGITTERVILRDNAAVSVAAVPALFADERGDIQQLGVLLYAALTGSQPDLDDPDLSRHLPRRVPRDLAVLCQRALDRDPARQLGSAAAFAAVLRPRARPQTPPAESAGRTGDRLGGLDPQPEPKKHDTAPNGLPLSDQGKSAAPPTILRAIPLPPVIAAPAGAAGASIPRNDAGPAAVAGPTLAEPAAAGVLSKPAHPDPVAAADAPTTTSRIPVSPGRSGAGHVSAGQATKGWAGGRVGDRSTDPARRSAHEAPGTADPDSRDGADSDQADDSDIDADRDLGSDSNTDPRGFPIRYAADEYDPWLDEDTGSWGSYDDDEGPDGSGSREGGQTRRKVLLYAVPLIALLVVVLLGVLVGKQFSDVVSKTDDGTAVVPTSDGSTDGEATTEGGESTAPGEPVALPPVSAAVYDPFGDGEPENDDQVGLSYDGDPGSAWQTLTYQSTPEFGNLKPGVGIIFDLGEERSINAIELATNLPGGAVEIRVGAAPDAALESYPVVGTLDPFGDTGSVALEEPVRARFVIVWFVRLVESNGGFKGALAECRILGS